MKKLLIFLTTFSAALFARGSGVSEGGWWTGPIVAASGHVMAKGMTNIEPYLIFSYSNWNYANQWQVQTASNPTIVINPIVVAAYGLTGTMDAHILVQYYEDQYNRHWAGALGDAEFGLSFQLSEDTPGTKIPDARIIVKEVIPIGPYKNLDPDLQFADAIGNGAWQTAVGVHMQKTFELQSGKLIRYRFNSLVYLPARVNVRGINSYGGAPDTVGSVFLLPDLILVFAYEVQLTQNWVFACDYLWTHGGAIKFKGFAGTNPGAGGANSIVGGFDSDLIGVVPAIEYNFNEYYGIIAGIGFTLAGRQNQAAISPTIAFNAAF